MIAGAAESLLPVLTPASTNPANEIAKRLTGRDYVSRSALSTFRTCPLKYRFRYVDGLPEESVSSALIFGTGIHTAVEQHYQAILSGASKPDLDALLFAYRSAWLPHDPDAISFGSKETRATLDVLASKMLTAFLNSPAASVQGRVLGVEEEIRGMLINTGWPISCPHRGSTGIAITASLRQITSSGPPSLRSRSGTSASGKRPRPAGIGATVMPRKDAVPRPQAPAHTTPHGLRGRN